MRRVSWLLVAALFVLAVVPANSQEPQPAPQTKRPIFDLSAFRPVVVLHDVQPVTEKGFLTVTGVVFSRAPIEKVSVGDRTASTRPAEPKDLIKLKQVPQGVADAPNRTYFEVPDAVLAQFGANDLDIVAFGNDGRVSDTHRVTVLRTLAPPPKS